MARPKYSDDRPTAKTRLKEGFWQLLSKKTYSKITVKDLVKAAGVNPNTFYYHYQTMDDLAMDALNDEKLHEIPAAIHDNIFAKDQYAFGKTLEYIAIDERWKRIRLFVTDDSPVLQQHFYNMLEGFWLSFIGAAKEELSETDRLDLTFILHGAISIIRRQQEEYNLDFIKDLPSRPLGQGIIRTMDHLISKYRK